MKTFRSPVVPLPTVTAGMMKECAPNIQDTHDELYGLLTLEDFSMQEPETLNSFRGGESYGLQRLENNMKDDSLYEITNNNFRKDNPEAAHLKLRTTCLSPYMNYGCVSVRTFWHNLAAVPQNKCVVLRCQLMYREFFYLVASQVNNFTKMKGNRICRQIEWYENDDHVTAWRNGQTGYPWIDAVMRQMKTEGFVPHVGRFAVAMFLTIGDLGVSWEHGQQAFEEYLIDGDYAMNAGCWMWCSGSAFKEEVSTRSLDPVKFGRKWDPNGNYVRKYCPELKEMPLRYLFSPWTAPIHVQEVAKCRIGIDYPEPIIEHSKSRSHNTDLIRALSECQNEGV